LVSIWFPQTGALYTIKKTTHQRVSFDLLEIRQKALKIDLAVQYL